MARTSWETADWSLLLESQCRSYLLDSGHKQLVQRREGYSQLRALCSLRLSILKTIFQKNTISTLIQVSILL